jgi:hypothetical protein
MYFDEEFYGNGDGYNNYLSGEQNPANGCTGDLAGKIKNMVISGSVAGRPLSRSDFIVDDDTVPGLEFEDPPPDPHPSAPHYQKYPNSNAYEGSGAGAEIDDEGVEVFSATQCLDRCQADWSCDCVVYSSSESMCWKRKKCKVSKFDADPNYDVYVRLWETTTPPIIPPLECSDVSDLAYKNKKSKDCGWVGGNPSNRCQKTWEGKPLENYCPETCGICDGGCVDDEEFRYRDKPTHDCVWVKKKSSARCGKKWKGQTLGFYCPRACGTCS